MTMYEPSAKEAVRICQELFAVGGAIKSELRLDAETVLIILLRKVITIMFTEDILPKTHSAWVLRDSKTKNGIQIHTFTSECWFYNEFFGAVVFSKDGKYLGYGMVDNGTPAFKFKDKAAAEELCGTFEKTDLDYLETLERQFKENLASLGHKQTLRLLKVFAILLVVCCVAVYFGNPENLLLLAPALPFGGVWLVLAYSSMEDNEKVFVERKFYTDCVENTEPIILSELADECKAYARKPEFA